jgi:hypothetical protein
LVDFSCVEATQLIISGGQRGEVEAFSDTGLKECLGLRFIWSDDSPSILLTPGYLKAWPATPLIPISSLEFPDPLDTPLPAHSILGPDSHLSTCFHLATKSEEQHSRSNLSSQSREVQSVKFSGNPPVTGDWSAGQPDTDITFRPLGICIMLPPSMPFRRERTAPTLDLSDPLGILQYFKDLEYLFEKHQVLDDQEKKHAAVYYPSVRVEWAWKCEDTFDDPMAPFQDFKSKILGLYPATTAALNPNFADLEQLVSERSSRPIGSKMELGEYYRNVRVISQSLIERGHISKGIQARQLLASFEPGLATAVWTRLTYKFPDRLPDDLYQTKDIYEAALYTLAWQYESVFLEPQHDIPSLPTPVAATETPPRVLAVESLGAVVPSEIKQKVPQFPIIVPPGPSALKSNISPIPSSISLVPCAHPRDMFSIPTIVSKPSSIHPGPSAHKSFSIPPCVLDSTCVPPCVSPGPECP